MITYKEYFEKIKNEIFEKIKEEEESERIILLIQNEITVFFIAERIKDKIEPKENEIIFTYNLFKYKYKNMKFEDARNIIKQNILSRKIPMFQKDEILYILNKSNNIKLNKNEIKKSIKYNAFKEILLNKIIKNEIDKTNFFEKNLYKINKIKNTILNNII